MPTPVRVVLVGCGWFACVAHIPALKRLEREGRIRLVGLCSRSEASVARASRLYSRQDLKHYLSLEDVAQDPDVDLVDLTLPIEIMPDAIKLFLSAGKHVISEKPGAPSVATGIELMEHHARLDRPVVWAVAENWRFKKTTQMVEDIVASGVLGEIRFADFTYLSFQKPDNQRWRESAGYAGGYILDSRRSFYRLDAKDRWRDRGSQRVGEPAHSLSAACGQRDRDPVLRQRRRRGIPLDFRHALLGRRPGPEIDGLERDAARRI